MSHSNATGATISVVSGGIGTILVVLAVAWLWPETRQYGKLGVKIMANHIDFGTPRITVEIFK